MQTQADIRDIEVIRHECVETTALGAAYLAGLACGFLKDEADIVSSSGNFDSFTPAISSQEREKRIAGWKKAVGMLL